MALLRVISGPDTGATAEVAHAPVVIGRGERCGLKLTDPSVSIIHAAVEPIEHGHRVRDLESTSGTAVNGRPATEHRLSFGDVITIGDTAILFGVGGQTARTESVGSMQSPLPGTKH